MSDGAFSFTVATVAEPGLAATKRIIRHLDGRLEKSDYDRVALWCLKPMTTANIVSMAEVLRDLASRADRMILMGRPRPGLQLDRPQLRRWAAADPSTNTLEAVDRQWLPIDLDDVAVPPPLGRGDRLDDAARYVRDKVLPPEFRGIAAAATATSSSGLKGDAQARLRLFFALDGPLSLDVMRRWTRGARAAGLPVDPAVIQAGQPIYTARPLFQGIADPVPPRLRAFVLEGSRGDRVCLVTDRYEAASSRADAAAVFAPSPMQSDWRRYMRAAVGGPDSFFVPLTRAFGGAARDLCEENEVISFARALVIARADPERVAHYSEDWMRAALRRFKTADLAAEARRKSLLAELLTPRANGEASDEDRRW
jgi:hypothetical protein